MFSIPGHAITLSQAAILLDDGLFRGVPAWGRTFEYKKPKYFIHTLPDDTRVHYSVTWLLNGGQIHIKDETARDDRDTIYLFDLAGLKRGLDLLKNTRPDTWYYSLTDILTAGLDKATDLTQYGNAVIQLAVFGDIKHGL